MSADFSSCSPFVARGHRQAGKPAGAEINNAKIVLATEATAMLDGASTALAAEQTARETFVAAAQDRIADALPSARA